ncbi:MAG: hypothetical protein ACRCUY_13790 [Thermoguttaceae bacterium]
MSRFHIIFLIAVLLIPTFCSCQSQQVTPHDPFAMTESIRLLQEQERTSPPKIVAPSPALVETESIRLLQEQERTSPPKIVAPSPALVETETMLLQPTYKPIYRSEDETRLVKKDAQKEMASVIRGQNQNSNGESLRDESRRESMTVNPELSQQAVEIRMSNGIPPSPAAINGATYVASRNPYLTPTNSEYLFDGGDTGLPVLANQDWSVQNLRVTDTVAHFDTLDGRILVEPSNRVEIYAPRFGSIRKVEGVLNEEQIDAVSVTNNRQEIAARAVKEQLGRTAQEEKVGFARVRDQLSGVRGRSGSHASEMTQGLGGFDNFESVMSYNRNLKSYRLGSKEILECAEGHQNAKWWSGAEGILVRIDMLAPISASSIDGAESVFHVKSDDSKTSKLRLIKVASKKSAQPGEIVEFTLRFDNIGTETIGNVTILDNLTTRLEFVPESAQCSIPAGFAVEPNDVGSFILRFEITDPIKPQQFGVVQFQCRVR